MRDFFLFFSFVCVSSFLSTRRAFRGVGVLWNGITCITVGSQLRFAWRYYGRTDGVVIAERCRDEVECLMQGG